MNSISPRVVQLTEANGFLKEHPEIQYVDLLITDMNGVIRGQARRAGQSLQGL